ncbi:hypothetical protein T459_27827 [Capsicum annuum]|uniref:Ubiquitin-like protease family profile domain-containing protein n=1 Tax=Capsicum annuum TaxID=4072 RepID=A0A2G2YF22_CAPAN|nr:hypothetical protein T459_27827 [Capsicum annuum]
MILEDVNQCREYGWGELSFDETISSLKNSLKPTKTIVGSSYQLVGFPYEFMKGAVEAFSLEHELPSNNESEDKRFSLLNQKLDEKNAGAEDLLPFPLVEEFSKSSPYFELQDFGGTEVDKDNIDETKNYGNVDSIINNVISSVFAAFSSFPTSHDVKNTQAERSEFGGMNSDTMDVISDVDATMKFVNVDSTTCVVEISLGKYMYRIGYSKISKELWKRLNVDLGKHLDTIFYYMRKKAKYEPNIVVKFTTTDFVFRNKIDTLYHDFVENRKDFSAIPEKHEVEEYIRVFYCDANVPWNKVDYLLFPVYVPWEKSKLRHWILGVFDFTELCIYIYDSNRTRCGDKVVQKVMLPYQTLIPYFLKKVNFYLEKGIAKSENDTLPIKMVDELPQQTQCIFCAFAEYVIHGRDTPKEIEIGHVHMRYGTLLWDYGKRKLEIGIKDNTTEKVGRLFGKEKRKRTHQE